MNAISSSFADASAVDWENPSTLFSLLNMLVLGVLMFLCLVALERINGETMKLLKRLDQVGVEVSKVSSVDNSVSERVKSVEAHKQIEHRALRSEALGDRIARNNDKFKEELSSPRAGYISPRLKDGEDTQAMLRQALSDLEEMGEGIGVVDSVVVDVHKIVQKIIAHNEVSLEATYLQNILAELRDQANVKKILGIEIDRAVLSKMFGGVVGVLYLIVKDTADQLLRKYSFAGAMLGVPEDEPDESQSSGGYCTALNPIQEQVLEAALNTLKLANETCAYNISVNGLQI